MLLNLQSPVPELFHIFVDQYNPVTVHNFTFTKTFTSAAYANCALDKSFLEKYLNGTAKYAFYEPCERDVQTLSPYCLTIINDYRVEYDAEYFRKKYYPLYPSRFSAIFAFGDYETCQKVANKYNWNLDSVKKFKSIDNPLTRVIKVNMEIVSLSRRAYKVSSLDEKTIESIWKSYWEGSGDIAMELPGTGFKREICHSGEIFEYYI